MGDDLHYMGHVRAAEMEVTGTTNRLTSYHPSLHPPLVNVDEIL